MKILSIVFGLWMVGPGAFAAKLDIARVDHAPTHSCEIENVEVEARYDNQPSRVIVWLKDTRGSSHLSCPKNAWIPASSREEALRLFSILRETSQSSCLISGGVTSTRTSLHCDAGFNVRSKVH